jgi:hypothetical protein
MEWLVIATVCMQAGYFKYRSSDPIPPLDFSRTSVMAILIAVAN